MKMASKSIAVYAVAFAVLLLWAYFVQSDTRRVDGTSMLPTLEGGDLVVIQSVSLSDVHVGNIIVYGGVCSALGESVIHRVVNITAAGLITKGDNNPGTDQALNIATRPITQQCLEGKVDFVIPYVELIAFYVDTYRLPQWYNYIPSMVILLLVVISFSLGTDDGESEKKSGEEKPPTPPPASPE